MSEEKNDIGTIIESVNGSDIMNNYFLGYATYTICDRAIPKIEDAVQYVLDNAEKDEVIIAAGSLYMIGHIRSIVK